MESLAVIFFGRACNYKAIPQTIGAGIAPFRETVMPRVETGGSVAVGNKLIAVDG